MFFFPAVFQVYSLSLMFSSFTRMCLGGFSLCFSSFGFTKLLGFSFSLILLVFLLVIFSAFFFIMPQFLSLLPLDSNYMYAELLLFTQKS